MIKKFLFVGLIFLTSSNITAQQSSLPNLTIRSIGTRVIVSWKQDYKKPISNLNIQRSYDSLKNYKTIGEVLSPQSIENGYIDANPPYNKMYYRVFVAFEGGSYAYSNIYRAKKDTSKIQGVDMPNTNLFPITKAADNFPWLSIKPNENIVLLDEKPKITYPSQRIFTLKDNNILITLQNTDTKKYSIKFYDEFEKFLFEIKKVKEDNYIIEKINFGHTGWFRFELYENGELIENNKFQILKPLKGI